MKSPASHIEKKPPPFPEFHPDIQEDLRAFEESFRTAILQSSNGIGDYLLYVAEGRGKRFRPLLVALVSRACGIRDRSYLPAALAIEFFHTATLVHDDVVDQSQVRRGMKTVNAAFGDKSAVLLGDFLLARSMNAMLNYENFRILRVIAEAAESVAAGELLQIKRLFDYTVSEEDYDGIIMRKTASLIRASTECGALAAGLPDEGIRAMARMGQEIGIAFQIVDDLLDFTGEQRETGKAPGNDLAEGKITLPLIYSLRIAPPEERAQVIRDLQEQPLNETFPLVLEFIRLRGGIDYARQVAFNHFEKARNCLDVLPPSPYRKNLSDLLEFAVYRRW